MPMTNELRSSYIQRAGVTPQQIDEFVGELPVHEGSVQALGLSKPEVDQTHDDIRQVLADVAIIAAKYSAMAQRRAAAAQPDELEIDRGYLDELLADEYALVNPFGEELGKAHIVDGILSGRIEYSGMGRAGFEPTDQTLHLYGDTALARGDYRLRARGRARHVQTGELARQRLSGEYRITNTYVLREGRWQAVRSQMTRVPPNQRVTFTSNI